MTNQEILGTIIEEHENFIEAHGHRNCSCFKERMEEIFAEDIPDSPALKMYPLRKGKEELTKNESFAFLAWTATTFYGIYHIIWNIARFIKNTL